MEWSDWYTNWINQEPTRFYAYIKRSSDGQWIGDINFHYTKDKDWWDMGIVIYAPFRGKGYVVPAMKLMLDHAFRDCGISRIHNDFEIARNEVSAWQTHLSVGFRHIGTVDGFREMMITKEEYLQETANETIGRALSSALSVACTSPYLEALRCTVYGCQPCTNLFREHVEVIRSMTRFRI